MFVWVGYLHIYKPRSHQDVPQTSTCFDVMRLPSQVHHKRISHHRIQRRSKSDFFRLCSKHSPGKTFANNALLVLWLSEEKGKKSEQKQSRTKVER